MSKEEEQLIDLNKLTHREMLIGLAVDMKEMKSEVKLINERETQRLVEIKVLQTKAKMWGAIAGLGAALLSGLFERIIK